MKEVSQDTIEAFASLFKGRTDAHGQVNECIYEPVTLKHYEKHLKGEVNLGIYFVLDDSTCHFAAIDLDEKDFSQGKGNACRADQELYSRLYHRAQVEGFSYLLLRR